MYILFGFSFRVQSAIHRVALLGGLAILNYTALSGKAENTQCTVGTNQVIATRTFPPIAPKPGPLQWKDPLSDDGPSGLLNVIGLGDSVVWGDGLKNPDKFIVMAAHEIADKTQRPVQIVSYAHSGAHLKQDPQTATWVPLRNSDHGIPPGDLDSSSPDVAAQANCAAHEHPEAEIVVMDGCINEVGATAIALPPFVNGHDVQQIDTMTTASCGGSMKGVLQAVKDSFPHATIVLLNYYRVISLDSNAARAASAQQSSQNPPEDRAAMAQVKKLAKLEAKAEQKQGVTQSPVKMSKEDQLQADMKQKRRWQDNSEAFLKTSHGCFAWAMASVNGEAETDVRDGDLSCPFVPDAVAHKATPTSRVYLAVVDDDPTFAYGAPHKHIWSYSVPFLYFFAWRPDEVFGTRRHLCVTHFDNIGQQFKCRINPIAHPNRLGADAYAESIAGSTQKSGVLDAAWAMASPTSSK